MLQMLSFLVLQGRGSPNLVDNHGNNAAMLAAAESNRSVLLWFIEYGVLLGDGGFDWTHRNLAGRNMLSLVRYVGANAEIVDMCMDLALHVEMTDDAPQAQDPHRHRIQVVGNRRYSGGYGGRSGTGGWSDWHGAGTQSRLSSSAQSSSGSSWQ